MLCHVDMNVAIDPRSVKDGERVERTIDEAAKKDRRMDKVEP